MDQTRLALIQYAECCVPEDEEITHKSHTVFIYLLKEGRIGSDRAGLVIRSLAPPVHM